MRRKQCISWAAILLALGGVACAGGDQPSRADLLPELTLRDSRGATFDPATLAGKRVLVNFWSTTCAACIHEMPALQAAADQGDDIALVLVAIDGSARRADTTARANGVRAPVLVDGRRLADQLRIRQVPTTMVIDRDGRTRRVLIGERDRAAFDRALAEL